MIEAPGPIVKTLLATLLIAGLVIPITRQFLLPALPVITRQVNSNLGIREFGGFGGIRWNSACIRGDLTYLQSIKLTPWNSVDSVDSVDSRNSKYSKDQRWTTRRVRHEPRAKASAARAQLVHERVVPNRWAQEASPILSSLASLVCLVRQTQCAGIHNAPAYTTRRHAQCAGIHNALAHTTRRHTQRAGIYNAPAYTSRPGTHRISRFILKSPSTGRLLLPVRHGVDRIFLMMNTDPGRLLRATE